MASRNPRDGSSARLRKPKAEKNNVYLAYETLPTPFPSQSLHRAHSVPNGLFAPFALGHPQTDVTRLAVWVAFVYREPNVIIEVEFAITRDSQPPTPRRRREERVPTFRTEEMLLVIRPLPQRLVVQRNKPLVNNSCLAVIAARSKVLRDNLS
jgi:hypothetical protein